MCDDAGRRPRSAIRRAIVAALPLLILVAGAAPTQAATVVSETTWGGANSEVTSGIAVGADGSTYLAGTTFTFGDSPGTIFLIKFTGASLAWQRTWEAPDLFGTDEARDVAVAPDGSVYVTGSTQGVAGDAALLKFSSDGSLAWQQRWGGNGTEAGEALAVGIDGSVYVTGGTSSFGPDSDLFLLRFDPAGTLVSQRVWQGPGAAGQGVAVAGDGSVYVAGLAARPGASVGVDVVLLKIDPAGMLVWQRTYSTAEIADARGGAAVASDGSVYVAGTMQEVTQSSVVVDALLVKFAPGGSLVWDRAWGGRSGETGEGVAVRQDGTVLLAGNANSFGAGSDDAFLLQLSPSGRGLDSNTWGGAGIDHADGVAVAPDGTIELGGTTENPPPNAFLRAPTKTSRLRGTVAASTAAFVAAAGTVTDPGGTVATPSGTTTFAGGFEAVLVRVAR